MLSSYQKYASFQSKLVHYFSKQIVIKNKLSRDDLDEKLSDYPRTHQWLSVVGLPKETIKVTVVNTVEP